MSAALSTQWRLAKPDLRARNFGWAALTIAAASVLGYAWLALFGPANLTLIFLAGVLFTGFRYGMWPAIFAAFMGFLSYNYFLEEPRLTLTINADDVLNFVTFLLGGLLMGGLTGRLSDRAREAKNALGQVTSLFEASRNLSTAMQAQQAAERLLDHLEAKGCSAAVWLLHAGELELAAASADLEPASVGAIAGAVDAATWRDEWSTTPALLAIRTGKRCLGLVAIWPARGASVPGLRWVQALIDLAAVAIDRARLVEEIAETRVVAEKEGLRTALLSSLSHDLHTPIATILASATSLQTYDSKFDAETRYDLLATIQDESERLNRYVANLLQMTRLESGELHAGRSLIDPREAMYVALRHLERRLQGRKVVRDFTDERRHIDVNPVLVEQALTNVIENAVEHTPPGSTIHARIAVNGERVVLSIEDEGAGVATDELERIFEKFFRGGGDRRRSSGVGLGLSVTRGLVESFGGTVRAVSPARDGKGTRIEIQLPAHPAFVSTE